MIQQTNQAAGLTRRFAPFVTACSALLAVATSQGAITWHDAQFGGFVSQGYLQSSANDYFGNTSNGTADFREYGLNGSYARGQWRIGAQIFGQKLGGYGDDKIKLDWANLDYQPAQWFGVRVGRVKMPRGLYNEALDLDAVRPFILLPQSVYDARLRDFSSAVNGGLVYGNVELHRAGSIDYKVFYGKMPIDTESGANDYFNSDYTLVNGPIDMDHALGGAVFWNTPLQGLRFGYSYSVFKDLLSNRSSLGGINPHTKRTSDYKRHLLSAEYVTGDWTFAVEAGRENAFYNITARGGLTVDSRNWYYYGSAARRLNKWLELGGYYSRYTEKNVSSVGGPSWKRQGDAALSVRFDVNEHLLFKVEGHYFDGAGKVFDSVFHPQPQSKLDQSWSMVALKATVLF